tara:strand:- start:616 stop:780 length:165 start_codon:yes stop_codon:yes gene_type:complete
MSINSNRYSNCLKSRVLTKKRKIFFTGFNKTGTTSLSQVMKATRLNIVLVMTKV